MMQVGETGHKHIEIGFSISTDDASWGNGHNTGTGGKSAYNNMQVGEAQHSEIGFLISTDDASWGNGPQTH
ncbi:nitrogen regulation protein NIFR3 [Staphylococcus aureus]|uniref:hypothetical protein n=1 Tax=Staphylococcus aureus TaxID=1280 RepID=UPI000DA5235D|nr:hypothetical protein [Staphylococcus aureus]SRD99456.1 nitrogen regulation protein NIFR3 [Staphylococcus aureus]